MVQQRDVCLLGASIRTMFMYMYIYVYSTMYTVRGLGAGGAVNKCFNTSHIKAPGPASLLQQCEHQQYINTHTVIQTTVIHCIHALMRDEKEGRKKQARSNKQQGKATQHTQCTCTCTCMCTVFLWGCEEVWMCTVYLWGV